MDPLTIMAGATAVGGGMGLVGSVLTNRANQAMAEQQMDFQERMSNTAYQRAMADMKAAGINPMLVTKLGGASTPPGASATLENPGKHLEDTAGKMGQLMATKATLEMERDKTAAQVARDVASARFSDAQTAAIETDTWIKTQRFGREFEGLGADVTIKQGEARRQALYDQELRQRVLNAGAQYEAITTGTTKTKAETAYLEGPQTAGRQADTAFTEQKTIITKTVANFVGELATAAKEAGHGVNDVYNWLKGPGTDWFPQFKPTPKEQKLKQEWDAQLEKSGQDTRDFMLYLLRMAFTTSTK